jgi:hypothetical protein
MIPRSTLTIAVGALAVLGFSACKTVYSDTFSYKKNSFKAPPAKTIEIKAPTGPLVPEGGMPGGIPAGPGGLPGAPMPDAGGIPGIPGGAPAVPPAPGAPAVPGVPPAL